jgi:hypothetical protein
LSTDPSLLSYFQAGGAIRTGLEVIDRDGGSSPLRIVVEHADPQPLDRGSGAALIRAFHDSILSDPSVGSVISPALLFAEIQRSPLAADRPVEEVLDLPFAQAFLAPFFTPDRTRAHFLLRMHESGRQESRRAIMDRVHGTFERNGLHPVQTGGLYQLQAQLASLVASSLQIALAGLIVLFAGIAWLLSRSFRTVAAMTACLVAIPCMVLGTFGHAGIAVDIISSPAANVALAMGVDTMIHLIVRVRRLRDTGLPHDVAWTRARAELWHPIVGAGLIIGAGFAIFTLSTFPPTDRFGIAVVLGTLTAVVMALVGLPMMVAEKLDGVEP